MNALIQFHLGYEHVGLERASIWNILNSHLAGDTEPWLDVCFPFFYIASMKPVVVQETVIRGHDIYKSVWSPMLGEIMSVDVDWEHGNLHDRGVRVWRDILW